MYMKINIVNMNDSRKHSIPVKINNFVTEEQKINVTEITNNFFVRKPITTAAVIDEINTKRAPRVIVGTSKERDLFTKIDILVMKIARSMFTFTSIIFEKNIVTESVRKFVLKLQNRLLLEKYYKQWKIFSQDEIYDVAIEIVHEVHENKMKLEIAPIKERLTSIYKKVSNRQVYKVYRYILDNKLV